MLKLLALSIVLAAVYFWYRGQQLLTERRKAEIEHQQRQQQQIVDVDAEVIHSSKRK